MSENDILGAVLSESGIVSFILLLVNIGLVYALRALWQRNRELEERTPEMLRETLEALNANTTSIKTIAAVVKSRNTTND